MDSLTDVIRIVIADDHSMFRECLRTLLEAEPGFVVAGEAADGQQAIERTVAVGPDVVLLDLSMPRVSGLDALDEIARRCPRVRPVLVTGSIERRQVVDALKRGARGIFLKDTASQLLYRCVREVAMGGYWVEHGTVPDLVHAIRRLDTTGGPSPADRLTPRERQIVGAIAEGATNEDVGREFNLRLQTVKNHLSSIFDKLGVSNRLELAL